MTNDKLPFGQKDNSFQSARKYEGLKKLSNQFYHLVETEKFAKELHLMHTKSKEENAHRLALFLCAWLGGPRDFFKQGGVGMISTHKHLMIDKNLRDIWLQVMFQAIDQQKHFSTPFKKYLKEEIRIPAHKIAKNN